MAIALVAVGARLVMGIAHGDRARAQGAMAISEAEREAISQCER